MAYLPYAVTTAALIEFAFALWFWADARGLKRILASHRALNNSLIDRLADQAVELFDANSELMRFQAAEDRRKAVLAGATKRATEVRRERALAKRAGK